jgi:predicted small lipoprotein YifL
MKTLFGLPAATAVVLALTGCGQGEYCVPPDGASKVCGAAARAWCDETSPHRSSLEMSARINQAPLQRLQSTDDACSHVGGL